MFAVLLLSACTLKSDTELRETFAKQKNAIETLVRMAIDDPPMQIVSIDFVRPEKSKLSEDRIRAYRDLMREIGAQSISADADKSEVWLDFSSTGAAFDSTHKGIVYLPHKPARYPLVKNLDQSPGDGIYLVSIEGSWYIYYLR